MGGRKVFVIAEAGSNWRMGTVARDLKMARTLIDTAAEAGADAVKFQTYRADTVYVPNAGNSDYLSQNGIRESIIDIFKDLSMPYEMIPKLAAHCRKRRIEFMSSVFSKDDFEAVDPHTRYHKIASYEITHLRLIELAARSRKPTILSTGAATLEEIDWAVDLYKRCGGRDLSLLQCTARYPAPVSALNIRAIGELLRRYKLPVGLSDHSRDVLIGPIAAVAAGATIIEKHYTLHNRLPGPDHAFAITAEELCRMVEAIRLTEAALGSGDKSPLPEEMELRSYAQRAVQAIRPIAKGEIFREGINIAILRPGKRSRGVHPRHLGRIEGARARRALAVGEGVRAVHYGG